MKRMNVGCGPDTKEGWVNVDKIRKDKNTEHIQWDFRDGLPDYMGWEDQFDFVLVNHVLCTMLPKEVDVVLENLYKCLKVGGQIQIIDVDMLKAFSAYHNGKDGLLPIDEGSIDHKLCMHLCGYGTRLSLYTPKYMREVVEKAGFINAMSYKDSKYDFRPKESLVVGATKGAQ